MDCITFIKMRSRKDLDGFHQKHRVRNIVKIPLEWVYIVYIVYIVGFL